MQNEDGSNSCLFWVIVFLIAFFAIGALIMSVGQ